MLEYLSRAHLSQTPAVLAALPIPVLFVTPEEN